MKKLVCFLMCIIMVFPSFCVLADNNSEELKEVLSLAKAKVEIPSELSEFNMSLRGNITDGIDTRRFEYLWETKDGAKNINLVADKNGNVREYQFYDRNDAEVKSDFSVTRKDCLEVVDAFVKKALNECFENENDRYVLKEDETDTGSLSGNRVSFYFTYERIKDGYKVNGNEASVYAYISGKTPIISSMSSSWDYESAFHNAVEIIQSPEEYYVKEYPIELVYRNKYRLYKLSDEEDANTPQLLYRFVDNNTGYIRADNGEKFSEKKNNILFNSAMKEEITADSATGGSALRAELTEEELKRIEEISSLISLSDAEKLLKDNKYLSIDENYSVTQSSLYKPDKEKDEYTRTIYLNFDTEQKSGDVYATLDAKTGRIISYSHNVYGPDIWDKTVELTDEIRKEANDKMNGFVEEAAGSLFGDFKLSKENEYNSRMDKRYERYIDGVRYIDNTMNVSYDFKENYISGYNISYTKDFKNLPKVSDAISMDKAKEIIFAEYPLTLSYVKGDDGYHLCYGNKDNGSAEIFAISGEKIETTSKAVKLSSYSDAEEHWVRGVSDKLLNVGIGYENGVLNPDEICSQKDFLRIIMCAVNKSSNYMSYTDDNLYSRLVSRGDITEEEKNPLGSVKREDAFVYMVRIMNHEEIANLSDIFKTDFIDNSDISKEKIGYAAILKGFGVISGDGTYVRPKDDITRAEVLSMAYNYIVK